MEIKPFKAFRFDEAIVGDVGRCVAPPYDVISASQQTELYKKSPYNIVRITRGKTTPFDNDSNNRYTRAANYLKTWIEKGVLKQDSAEAIYAYVQNFQLAGRNFQRNSFIALAKLEEFSKKVRPHEETLEEPKIDRLHLKRATVTKFGLVFMLYEDEQKNANKIIENAARGKPLIDFLDEQNVRHRLFAVTTEDSIEAIVKMMHDKNCIIADGHHRYETALRYWQETGNPAAAYQMIAFTNTHNEGLIILATHRLVSNIENFHFEKLIGRMKEDFEITKHQFDSPQTKTDAKLKMSTQMKTEYDKDKNAFGIYNGNNAFYVAVLKDKRVMDLAAPNASVAWRSLDVTVLHKLILEKLLGIGEQQLAEGTNIEYVKDTDNAIDESIAKIDSGQKQVAFFMNPIKMQQIEMVTAAGEKMPQKSTYFYPKVYTGLTINKL
jgi:uncharacterized protein (DUF1015 family)